GFIDGTANPTSLDLPASALVGDEDADFVGGSYVVVQKYLHDLSAWAKIPTPLQEEIIGRTKIDNIEIDDGDWPRKSHKSLATHRSCRRQRIRYTARQHAFWSSGATGVRHVLYRLFSISLGDREDAATNVCRRPAWRLRPAARFLDPAHRHNVLRAISPYAAKTCSGGAGEAYRSYSVTRYPASLEIARFSMSASGHKRRAAR